MAHHTSGRQAKKDGHHIKNPDKCKMHEVLVGLLVRGVVVAGGGGVFNVAVVGHRGNSPGHLKRRAHTGYRNCIPRATPLSPEATARPQPLVDDCRPTLASAARFRAATSSIAKRSIASLNKR